MYCTFQDADGGGMIPAAALAQLPATPDGGTSLLAVTRFDWTNTRTGGWSISLGGGSQVTAFATFR
jgi:hypothetical protein